MEIKIRVLSKTILQSTIEFRSNFLLVMEDPSKLALFYRSPSIANILLKEPSTTKDIAWFDLWRLSVEMISIV